MKEVLRYAPPAVGVQRETPIDFVINGYKIAAGTRIGVIISKAQKGKYVLVNCLSC